MYDDDDLNTSNPKLEKLIDKDKERIRLQQEDVKPKKKPAAERSASSSNNRGQKKMETSAQKFKAFLDSDVESTRKTNGDRKNTLPNIETSNPSTSNRFDVKMSTPVQSSKRPSSVHSSTEENAVKKRRSSISSTRPINYKPFGKLLEGVMIVISGIQVSIDVSLLHSMDGIHFGFKFCTESRASGHQG